MTEKASGAKRQAPNRKKVSAASLKRTIADERSRADQANAKFHQMGEMVDALISKVDALQAASMEKQHDINKKVTNEVLGVKEDGHFPHKHKVSLPASLKKASQALDAKNNPVILRDTVDTEQEEAGQYSERVMDPRGDPRESLPPIGLQDDGIYEHRGKLDDSRISLEVFMHDLVLIQIHDTTDETQVAIPEVTVGGVNQYLVRGQPLWIKRMFVERLARVKRTIYSQEKVRHTNGDETYKQVPHTALMYPFEVLEDTKIGKAWIRDILAEPY
tara:strand:+ start:807 stop:1628 length:822 start_codon:yes stop_codon:yes gene_type:complete